MPPTLKRREFLLRAATAGCAGAALTPTVKGAAEPSAKPSAVKITRVETFALQHKLPRAIGPSTTLYGYREARLVKISTDSGIVGWAETADVGGTQGIIETHLKKV